MSHNLLTLNVIIGKYYFYVKALNGKFYMFNEFVSVARDKISLEKIFFLYDWSRKRFQNKMVCFFVSFKYGMKFCLLN